MYIKIIYTILGLLIGFGDFFLCAQNKVETEADFYTKIAQNESGEQLFRTLESPLGKTLPVDKQLKWSGTTGYQFKPMEKIDNSEEMKEALNRMRKDLAVYLKMWHRRVWM